MWCKRCMVVMEVGTRYEQKKYKNKLLHKRYFGCPKCYDKIYNNSPNFQEILTKESEKSRR